MRGIMHNGTFLFGLAACAFILAVGLFMVATQ